MMSSYTSRTITLEWIEEIRSALRARKGYSQEELAKACGCSQAAISKVLRSPGTVSKFVEPMSDILGVELPPLVLSSPSSREILAVLEQLNEEGRAALIAHATLLLKVSPK